MSSLEWLAIARHGESIGNVAWRTAETNELEEIDVGLRDPDVPLSETGRRQAVALGRRLASLPAAERPTAVISSPYLRAAETARIALAEIAGPPIRYDERLRDRETGILYALTGRGIAARFPEEAARKRLTGKFYYRPPGGESWADVALRLRSAMSDIERDHPGGRVLIVAHDAVVMLFRYIVEQLTEQQLLEIERTLVPNASLAIWSRREGEMRLVTFNSTDHLEDGAGLPA
ncbi:histidine phosphatase family protein [Actinoallomurus bryophytorum]|uniref:phosphoglycerate mutase (2,3-diphosphoglycerate-dependent) n=1 Tax=Actinoallomurus bryophytorum TaxID=1490222 RepID=A0A543CNB1_9ACTN|nr:histidine phosphatase family protein [Actinoallomurus bryophytorum]TQL98598.1 broad specificity phosphatase PhoE [Actinoallomurus bryophytorum]